MKANVNLDLVLEQCLQAVDRGESIETCLERYPQWREELEGPLRAAQALGEGAKLSPDSEQSERIWSGIAARMNEQRQIAVTPGRFRRYLRRDRSED